MGFLPATDHSRSASALFRSAFGRSPSVVGRAPGRLNLIGEHTDYNAGLCLPLALPHATYAALAAREDTQVALVSAQREETWSGEPGTASGWAAYAAGVVWALREDGIDVPGVDIAVDSSVPLGAGLSSSAALGCSVAAAVHALAGPVAPDRLVRACIRAESELAGAPTGGMDQAVAVHGRAGHALLLDFRSGSRRHVPWSPDGLSLLVIDTGIAHRHADGEYAARRRECAAAAAALELSSLREASLSALAGRDESWVPRARHVVTEIGRVRSLVAAVEHRDWPLVGATMTASHRSLSEDFEVSCPELDVAVAAALEAGALGGRMTGGGFGGSAITLVPSPRLDAVVDRIDRAYGEQSWHRPSYLLAEAVDGITSEAVEAPPT